VGNIGVCGAAPLTVNYLMIVVGMGCISRFHDTEDLFLKEVILGEKAKLRFFTNYPSKNCAACTPKLSLAGLSL
jgi:hypothetical protein